MPTLSTEKTMTVAIYICPPAFLGVIAIDVHNLESWLERWGLQAPPRGLRCPDRRYPAVAPMNMTVTCPPIDE
jgi:hypothetical protein